MRKALLLLFLLLIPTVTAAECLGKGALLRKQIEAEQKFLLYRGELRLIAMDAVIAQLALEQNVTALLTLRNRFAFVLQSSEEAIALRDVDLIDERTVELEDLILRFRYEMRQPKDIAALRGAVRAALEEKDDRLQALRNQALFLRKTLYLQSFDRSLCVYKTVTEELDPGKHNIDRLLDRLRRIGDYRPNFEAAIDDAHRQCQNTPLFKCSRDGADDLRVVQRLIQENLRRLRDDITNQNVIDRQRGELQIARADIEALGEDFNETNWTVPTQEFDERFARLWEMLVHAEEKFAEEKYDIVDDLLDDIERDYQKIMDIKRRLDSREED